MLFSVSLRTYKDVTLDDYNIAPIMLRVAASATFRYKFLKLVTGRLLNTMSEPVVVGPAYDITILKFEGATFRAEPES
jgi:hypothetical protein